MKKTLGVISLAVLLSVQILTPVTYAVGDEDFVSETYVEESASEEVVEATDDVEEVSDEVSDEDDVSEETTEEDSSDEDSLDEDVLDGDEDSEDTEESDVLEEEASDSEGEEVSAGSSEESISEESPVLSEEDEAFIAKLSKQGSVAKIAEELGINWYTDSAKYAVLAGIEGDYYGTKEQNNIIREYLISHALELLKKTTPEEVVEGSVTENVVTEETVSEEVELTGLNEKEISGKKYYNGVVVNVLAPVKSFPEGTTLSIVPIKAKKELKEIKEQLVDQQEEITEDSTVVAFDISFLYSGEEVQPVSGQTVLVTFNYENHETLTEANEDEEQELKVYHLNDKDEDGNKVEDISEVKVEEVEIVKNEEGELVVDAESFSIYTIVTQVHDEWVLEDQLANFEYGEISIEDPKHPGQGITIMDRNLGATTNDITSTGSYGYYYQWGNNYGFDSTVSDLSDEYKTGVKVDVAEGVTEYSGNKFVYGSTEWMETNRDSLWQGQGPCPNGWHIPTIDEWNLLMEYYAGYYNVIYNKSISLGTSEYKSSSDADFVSGFYNYFQMPFAGARSEEDTTVFNQGLAAYLWSSSLSSLDNNNVHNLNLESSNVDTHDIFSPRASGLPVRCFKDTYTPSNSLHTITFNFDGGKGSTASINVADGLTGVKPVEDPVKAGNRFIGWYLGESTTPFAFETESITFDITLTAKYAPVYSLSFDVTTNGGDATSIPDTIELTGGDVIDLSGYTAVKEGYQFVGWSLTGGVSDIIMDNYNSYSVSENTTLYAVFSKTVTITFDVNGNDGENENIPCTMYNTGTTCSIQSPSISPKADYSVIGWSTANNRHQNDWTVGQNKDVSATGTYFAQTKTTPSEFTATFTKGTVAESDAPSQSCTPDIKYNGAPIDTDCEVTTPNMTLKPGYQNGKWKNGNSEYSNGVSITLTNNITYTATATPITYTITYVGADGLVNNSEYTVQDAVILPTISKSGWIFNGWYDNSGFTGTPVESIPVGSTGNKTFYAKWIGKTFTVNFNANGSEINKNSESCTVSRENGTCDVTNLPTITRDGFTIKGWSTNPNATSADIATNGTIVLSEANNGTTYYAITEKHVVVVFNGNGNGTYANGTCDIRNTATNCFISRPAITETEEFGPIGWSTSADIHLNQWSGDYFTTGAIYYAQTVSKNPYKVTYYGNGNTLFGGVSEKIEKTCVRYNNESSCEVSVPSIQSNLPNTPTVIGYISHPGTGNVPAEIGGVELNSTAISNNNLKINISSDTNLYAVTYAAPKTYHVTYVKGDNGVVAIGDGDTSCLIPATYNGEAQDLSCIISAPSISTNDDRTGNWGYDTNGKLIKYQDEIVIYADNTPVVAHSEGIYYVVSYILDGGEFPEGVVDTGSYQKGTGFTLPIPVKDGYTFLNWKNAQTQEVVTAISDEDEGAKTFIATWRKDSFKITYDNVGYDLTSLPKSYAYGSETSVPDLPDSARRGYVFAGWTWEGQNEPITGAVISATQEGDIEFVAHWNVREYTITYNTKNGVVTPANANPTTYTVESDDIHLVNPTRANSVFEGWMLEPVTVAVNDVYIYNGSIGDRTYTAKFSCEDGYQLNDDGTSCDLIEYDVIYKLNGGDNNENNPEKVSKNGSTYTITVYNPVKTGFTFEGWTTNIADYTCTTNGGQELEVCKSNNITTPIKIVFNKGQNVKLTANWEHVKIDVTTASYFTNNQTTQNLTTKEYNYEGIINIYTGDIVGYQTTGWSTTAGGEIVYRNGESKLVSELEQYITYPTPNAKGRISLYAVREPITYTIVYDVDGGVNDQDNPSERLITDVTFELKDPIKTGYDFVAWKTNKGVVVEDITKELLGSLEAPYTLYLKAFYEPRTDTKYTVYHVKQWIDGSYNTGAETTEVFTGEGTTDSPVTPEVRTYVGFTSPQQTTKDIAPDGKMYIIYNYVRAKNNYTYNTAVGATTKWKTPLVGWSSEGTTEEIFYETPIILTGEANIGYTWSGWDITSGGETTRINDKTHTFNMPLVDVVVTPVVDHNKWTLRFNVNGGTGDADALAEAYPVYYDDVIVYPEVSRLGYTFLGWYDGTTRYGSGTEDGNLKMPDSDLTLTAHWQANDFTLYVNHYKMNLSGEYPTEPTKSGAIATKIDADITDGIAPNEYKGFTLSGDAITNIHIQPDGSSVINYYYSRDRHNVRINENEGVIFSGTMSGEYYYETPVAVEALAKTGYTWSGWNVTSGGETVFTNLTGVEFVLSTGDVELTPFVTVNEYHLTVQDGSTIIFSGDVLYKTNISAYLGSLSKNGYTFNGWTNRPANDLMPANDLVIEAKWTKITSPSGGGGGGGGSSSSSDTNKDKTPVTTGAQEQEHGSAELTGDTKKVDELKEEKEEVKSEVKPIENMEFEEVKDVNANQLNKVDRTKLTKEQNEILDAYQWAYEHNVTTMVTLRDAMPEGVVTRGHLAKMVVNYATNVLGQKIPEKIPSECRWNDYRSDWESQEIKDYAVKACALGLMGLNMKKFQPKVWVSRAQFGTIMSRLLWGKKYAGGTPYYRNHLNALKKNGIMTQIGNPEGRTELRQWVWLMLMRAGEEK